MADKLAQYRVCCQLSCGWLVSDWHQSRSQLHLLASEQITSESKLDFDYRKVLAVAGDYQAIAYCLLADNYVCIDFPGKGRQQAQALAAYYLPASSATEQLHWRQSSNGPQLYCLPQARSNALVQALERHGKTLIGISDYGSALLRLVPANARGYYYVADQPLVYIDHSNNELDIYSSISPEQAQELINQRGADVHLGVQLEAKSRPVSTAAITDSELEPKHLPALGMLIPLLGKVKL